MRPIKKSLALALLSSVSLLSACDVFDDDDNPTSAAASVDLSGSGVKGPLAGAAVSLYELDTSQISLQGALLGEGSTGPNAAIQGLTAPASITGWVVLVFNVDADTTDLTTGAAPIFNSSSSPR